MNHTLRTTPRRLSIVVPLFNEADSVPALHRQLEALAARLDEAHGLAVEAIYVDDGSRDGSAGRNKPSMLLRKMPWLSVACPSSR